MELKWTSKGLSDLARLYEFLATVNQPAAVRTVQQLTAAPTMLIGTRVWVNAWKSLNHVMYDGFWWGITRCDTRSWVLSFTCYDFGTRVRIDKLC